MRDGVNFSLSTDDPGVQQTTLIDDYTIALGSFNFTIPEIQQLVSLISKGFVVALVISIILNFFLVI